MDNAQDEDFCSGYSVNNTHEEQIARRYFFIFVGSSSHSLKAKGFNPINSFKNGISEFNCI